MSPTRRRRRRSVRRYAPLLVAVVAVVAVFAVLWAAGAFSPEKRRRTRPADKVSVPLNPRAIQAFTKVNRGHLIKSGGQEFSVVFLDPDRVQENVLTNINDIRGRVLARDKPAGFVFTESDFLPRGSREGMTAGIPPGKRAMRVDSSQVKGVYGLRRGDRFDIVSTLPIDSSAFRGNQIGGTYGAQFDLMAKLNNLQKQATVKVVVQNGVVVAPLETRQEPITSNTLTRGQVVRTRPVLEIVLAIDPDEVAPLTEALAVNAELLCVPRSGNADDPENSETPELQPVSPFNSALGQVSGGGPLTLVETISGPNRSFEAVPRSE